MTLHRVSQEAARLRPDITERAAPTQATKLALRPVAIRIAGLNIEIADLDKHLPTLVGLAASRTLACSASASASSTPPNC